MDEDKVPPRTNVEVMQIYLMYLPEEGTTINIVPNNGLVKGRLFTQSFLDYLCNEIGGFMKKSLVEYEEQLRLLEGKQKKVEGGESSEVEVEEDDRDNMNE